MAALADRRIKASAQELREALRGRVTDHHRFLLELHLQHIEFVDTAIQTIDRNVMALIARMDQEVEAGQASFQSLIVLLMTIPGIDVLAALTTVYHMLKDGTQFQDLGADHFDRRSKELKAKRLVTQLAKLGFDAVLTPIA